MSKTVTLLAAQNANAAATSGVLDIADLPTASLQVIFTGANVVGTLTLQGSTDQTNWALLPGTTIAVTASVGHIYDISPTGCNILEWFGPTRAGRATLALPVKSRNY